MIRVDDACYIWSAFLFNGWQLLCVVRRPRAYRMAFWVLFLYLDRLCWNSEVLVHSFCNITVIVVVSRVDITNSCRLKILVALFCTQRVLDKGFDLSHQLQELYYIELLRKLLFSFLENDFIPGVFNALTAGPTEFLDKHAEGWNFSK